MAMRCEVLSFYLVIFLGATVVAVQQEMQIYLVRIVFVVEVGSSRMRR